MQEHSFLFECSANHYIDVISTSNAFLWTQVESSVGIICACLPTLKGPITKLFPNLFGSKNRSTRDAYNLESISKKGSQAAWKDNMYNRSTVTKGGSDDASSQ